MHLFLRLFLLLILLSNQACQFTTPKNTKITQKTNKQLVNQKQVYQILDQGMIYYNFDKQKKAAECKKLKQKYKNKPDWQTAWFLVYSLNTEFRCLRLGRTLELLNSIQIMPGVYPQLLWINENQLQLHQKLNKLHKLPIKLNRTLKQNNNLQNQLNETEIQRQEAISKIQALKAIETSINKKIEDE